MTNSEENITRAQITKELVLALIDKNLLDLKNYDSEHNTEIVCKAFEQIYQSIDTLTR